MTSVRSAVISFGAPRTGTTFFREVLADSLDGVFVSKIPEQAPNHPAFHPARSWGAWATAAEGLVALSRWLQKEDVVFVRSVRHPMEIVRSLVAARKMGEENVGGIASNSDEDVVDWIRSESQNFARQAGWLASNPYGHRIVTVRYELLDGASRRKAFANEVCRGLPNAEENLDRLYRNLNQRWKTKPARPGRLSTGVEADLSEDQLAYFEAALAGTIEREGYALGRPEDPV